MEDERSQKKPKTKNACMMVNRKALSNRLCTVFIALAFLYCILIALSTRYLRQITQVSSSYFRTNLPAYHHFQTKSVNGGSLFLNEVFEMMPTNKDPIIQNAFERIESTYHHLITLFSLRRCDHLYIDLGSSTGMQFRKLYEPDRYPDSSVHSYFQSIFHLSPSNLKSTIQRKRICGIGFEANPHHTARLLSLQSSYQSKGFPIIIFPETAVATAFYSNITFYQDRGAPKSLHEWGSSLHAWDKGNHMANNTVQVPAIDLAFFLHEILSLWYFSLRSNPVQSTLFENYDYNQHHILMKMDIEGYEHQLLPHLLIQGLLCRLNLLLIEWHPHLNLMTSDNLQAFRAFFQDLSRNHDQYHCSFQLFTLDDESYFEGKDPHPL